MSDRHLIEIVAADLRYLRYQWDETIDDHSLRRSSPVLRRLLVDNELQRAWKAAGFKKEPRITASSLARTLSLIRKNSITFAAAGGARYQGIEVRTPVMVNYAADDSEIAKLAAAGVPEETVGLRAFIEAPCIVVKGCIVSRRILIQYVANKLGGGSLGSWAPPHTKRVALLVVRQGRSRDTSSWQECRLLRTAFRWTGVGAR